MKQSLLIKAAVIAAVAFTLLLCGREVQSESQTEQAKIYQQPSKVVDKYPLDGIPANGISLNEQTYICSLTAVQCLDELPEQAIVTMVAGTGFSEQAEVIADVTEKYNVDPGLLIGIANAESQIGLHCLHNNCFGIMIGKGKLKSYPTLADGITDAARFIREKMHDRGRFTPEQMVTSYVGHPAPHWIKNVRKYYRHPL